MLSVTKERQRCFKRLQSTALLQGKTHCADCACGMYYRYGVDGYVRTDSVVLVQYRVRTPYTQDKEAEQHPG